MAELNYEKMIAERKAKAEAAAKEYFYKKKQRQAYYWVGRCLYGDGDSDYEALIPLTDEEVARAKELIIDTINECEFIDKQVSTVKEALEELTYDELFEQNEELRKLLEEPCEKANIEPVEIDFDKRHYFYNFSCLVYESKEKKVCEPMTVRVLLSDEEYLTLLALQLEDRDNFCFNQLLKTHPKLAIRLNSAVEGCIYGWCYPVHVPFAIIFEEVQADAEAIGGDWEKQNL